MRLRDLSLGCGAGCMIRGVGKRECSLLDLVAMVWYVTEFDGIRIIAIVM